jgi:hypothetical protein
MKLIPIVGAVLSCALVSNKSEAQFLYGTVSDAAPMAHEAMPVVSLDLENKGIAEALHSIAEQGKVAIALAWDVPSQNVNLHLDKVSSNAALEALAKTANLKLTKPGKASYRLERTPGDAYTERLAGGIVQQFVRNSRNTPEQNAAKPYIIRFGLPDGTIHDIQVAERDSFNVSTVVGNSEWLLSGTNVPIEDGTMTITFDFHHFKMEVDRRISQFSTNRVWNTQTDGMEIFNNAGMAPWIRVSIRKSANNAMTAVAPASVPLPQ